MSTIAAVLGRILIAALFIVSGLMKFVFPEPSIAMVTAIGLPGQLALAAGALEVIGGICLAVGLLTRLTALALAAFTVATIVLFHNRFDDPAQLPGILMHVALVGGLLLVFAHSQMWWSYDHMRMQRRVDSAARKADSRTHDAELRAARAEGQIAATDRVAPVTPVIG